MIFFVVYWLWGARHDRNTNKLAPQVTSNSRILLTALETRVYRGIHGLWNIWDFKHRMKLPFSSKMKNPFNSNADKGTKKCTDYITKPILLQDNLSSKSQATIKEFHSFGSILKSTLDLYLPTTQSPLT